MIDYAGILTTSIVWCFVVVAVIVFVSVEDVR